MKKQIKITAILLSVFVLIIQGCSHKIYESKTKGYYKVSDSQIVKMDHADSATIFGKIFDAKSKSVLSHASVQIEILKIGTFSDTMGNFSFKVPIGRYFVTARNIGNTELKTKDISVRSQEKLHVDFYLGTTEIE